MPENISYYTSYSFCQFYYKLPLKTQKIADQKYQLLKENSRHPSLKLKKIRTLWSIRV
ncbi:hypothetical protein GM3708_214 [Geminocystis sp. NIES-3708]|uniref:hypothetical protein n=1 Tax=Geminocystis sp. NIES-3708 TaxID=1615909 RepID=UPI0005FCBA9C|nr:hypothetical protein [Geminocystis sp. NIES-3708]BAQ59808.1 hypothetical protein GM3708_214 [Geminocystis sp. NIES-3708]